MGQCFGRKPEFLDHRVESAGLAAMAPKGVLDVEGCRAKALGHAFDFGRRHEQEDG